MDDDVLENMPVTEKKEKKKKGKAPDEIKPKNFDLEAAHKKFMMIMVGLFALILTLMIVFQNYMDFATDGGI